MAKSNTVWKIRDTKTGLFWNGDSTGCNHKIGTRFHTRNLLDETVERINNSRAKYQKGFPAHWEVLEVELHETVTWRMTGRAALVNAQLYHGMYGILDERIELGYGQGKSGANTFISLRQGQEFDLWPYMGLRRHKFQQSWKSFVDTLAPLGVLEKDMKRGPNGWVLFADKEVATMARMADTLKGVVEVNELRIAFARKFKFKTEDI